MKQLLLVWVSLFLSVTLCAQEWINPSSKNVKTVYYQGMSSSQTQAAKYTGPQGFISPTTGEHIACTKSINIVKDVWVAPEIDEVIPAPARRNWISLVMQPRALVYNVWQRSHEIISGISNHISGIKVVNNTPQAIDKTISSHSLILSKVNIAQDGDLANHRRRFDSLRQEHPDAEVIFMGVSRGAATTFQSVALLNKENPDLLNNAKLIHLEGCFDSVDNAARTRHPWLLKYDCMFNGAGRLLEKLTSFKRNGSAPIKLVTDFPKNIPVAFITSVIDREVPHSCTKNLVKNLLAAGHQDVYLLELKNSSHPRYMMDDATDSANYQHFMHALYKKYNLPYIPDCADKGKELLDNAKHAALSL